MDMEKIERAVRDILEAVGEDPDREGAAGDSGTGCQNVRRNFFRAGR